MNSNAKMQIHLVREMLDVPETRSSAPIPDPELRELVDHLWGIGEGAQSGDEPEVLYDKFRPGLSARTWN
ncbi:hypothetical protein KQI84_12910 [bacterium]|nr:hypothetical protein [bacterium]